MDLKGIKWVGNVYQKFEAMCLEVEEIIVQDTAKYVENQVQTVGNTVKKFYSDVVQELLPDDSADSGKPLPVEYTPVCSFKKKRESMNKKSRVVKEEEDVTEGKKDECAVKYRGLDGDDYDICTSPRQYSYGRPYRRIRPGRKQIFRKEEIYKVTRPCIQKESSSLSMVHSFRVKDVAGAVNSSDSPLVEVERHIFKEDFQEDDRAKNKHGLLMVNSVKSQDSDIRTENEQSRTVVKSIKSQDSEMRTDNEQSRTVVNSVRSQDSEVQASVATSFPAGSHDCRKETNEDSMETSSWYVSEEESEMLQRSVEESCILVDRDEFHCVFSDKKENHKPYKKIKDAISSRMKQNRAKEYKQLARQWDAEDVENGRLCGDNLKQIEENISSEESDWELL